MTIAADVKLPAPGAYVVGGHLFFRLLDGSSVCCQCIKGAYAEEIVRLYRNRRDGQDN